MHVLIVQKYSETKKDLEDCIKNIKIASHKLQDSKYIELWKLLACVNDNNFNHDDSKGLFKCFNTTFLDSVRVRYLLLGSFFATVH